MRFSSSALLAVAAAPLLAFAQNDSNGSNPFNIPTTGLNTEAGETVDLTWKPTTQGTVTIYLRSGASNDLNKGVAIASNIDNSGSFTWSVPDDIVRGSNYALEIVDDDDSKNTNYTPPFVIESTNNAAPSASSSASASGSATSSAASSTETDSESSTMTSTDSSSMSSTMTGASASSTHSGNSTMTTSTRSGSSATATNTDDSDATTVTPSEGSAARTTTFAGLLGLVALGALAL